MGLLEMWELLGCFGWGGVMCVSGVLHIAWECRVRVVGGVLEGVLSASNVLLTLSCGVCV